MKSRSIKPPSIPLNFSMVSLRVVLGLIFITHGFARLYHDSIQDFGIYLSEVGFPLGIVIAWVITIGEITFGSLLALGIKIRYCVIFHSIIIIAGLFLIHIPNGWFVVGHGTGGAEYSVLLLFALLSVYSYPYSPRKTRFN